MCDVKRSHTPPTCICHIQIRSQRTYDTSSIDLHQGFTSTERLVGANVVSASITDSCYFNPLYKEFYFLKLCGYPYFHFCCKLALETWARGFSINLRVHNLVHTHSLVSLQWSGLSNQWILLLIEIVLPTVPEMTKAKEWFLCLLHWETNGPTSADHLLLSYLFLLLQNLSWKLIVPTDNMWPKLHD